MSDLRKKDSGNWEARYRFRDARTGNILRRGRTFKTRRDAEARAHSDHRASPRLPTADPLLARYEPIGGEPQRDEIPGRRSRQRG